MLGRLEEGEAARGEDAAVKPEANTITQGDHLGKDAPKVLPDWPENFIDAVVTDPPYELGFMGKTWDSSGVAYSVGFWRDVLRTMKPGAHLLAFGGTRTYHRMACAIEDAGFEIRDQAQWIYGQGFPKSLDVAKAIDKTAGHWRGRAGKVVIEKQVAKGKEYERAEKGAPVTAAAAAWNGWGTALKPANEPICVARKPLSEATVAANVLRWGTGALNIEAGRVGEETITTIGTAKKDTVAFGDYKGMEPTDHVGRWPSNVLTDQYTAGFLDAQEAGCSKVFYVAKPDGGERNAGMEGEEVEYEHSGPRGHKNNGDGSPRPRPRPRANIHPTVKPVDLMAYLIQMVTPRLGGILDPFMGSGTTGIAAARLRHPFYGIEMSAEYIRIAEARIAAETAQGKLF